MKRVFFILTFIAIFGISFSHANAKTVPSKSETTVIKVENNQSVAPKSDKKDKKTEKSGCCAKKSEECPKAQKKCCAETKKDCPKQKKECKK